MNPIQNVGDAGDSTKLRCCSLSVVLFVLSLLFSLGAWQITRNIVMREAQASFDAHALDVKVAIQNRMQSYEHILLGGTGLFSAVGDVNRHQWRTYVSALKLEKHYPGIQGMGYSAVIAPGQRQAAVAKIRSEGFPDFDIKPPGERQPSTAIIFLEPFSGRNLRAFGFDMFSEPTRRAAMERARDTGLPSMSRKVTLLQESEGKKQVGILVYVPVYRQGAKIDTLEERRTALQGYVYSPFRMDDLMRGILGEQDNSLITLQIFEGMALDEAKQLYASSTDAGTGGNFVHLSQMEFGHHVWTVRVQGTPQFEAMIDTDKPRFVLIGGMAGSVLIFALFMALQTSRNRAVQLAMRMTEHLRHTEERYARAVSGTNDGIWEWEPESGKAYYSPRFIELMGYRSEEFLPRFDTVDALLHPDDYERLRQALKAHWARGAPYDTEARFLTKDRGYRYFRVKGQAVRGPEQRVLTMAGSLSDVTEKKEAELSLRNSEQRFRALVEHAPVGIFLTDLEGSCDFVNDWWSTITGLSLEEARGTGWSQALHPDDRDRVGREWALAVEDCRQFSLEYRFINQGREVWVSGHAVALTDADGRPAGYIGSIFDLTERKRVEQLKNEFISTVSHELRTPLTSIRGSLGLMLGGAAGPVSVQAAKLLGIAANNGERLVRLINDILDIEKLESGKLQFDMRRYEVQAVLDQAINVNQAYATQFQVALDCPQPLPGAFAHLDADRTLQVLTNLISNAVKFSPAGASVEIALRRIGGRLRVEVSDQGAGIPEEFQQRIFQKFAQADSSDTRAKGGTGLGLNISKAIVERQGGTIGFTSKGGGTTFYFDFAELMDAEPSHNAKEAAADPANRILVCEDDPDVAVLLGLILNKEGYAVDIAHCAAEADALLVKHSYLAMTLDIGLPGKDGLSYARELRIAEATRSLPIVVVSAETDQGGLRASALGFADWLTKPIDQKRLLAALKSATGGTAGRKRILHVEDDAELVQVVEALLGMDYELTHAPDLAAGKQYLAQERFDLLILDVGLPDGHGEDLLLSMYGVNRNLPVIVFSGQEVEAGLHARVSATLVKARTTDDLLLATIRRIAAGTVLLA